MKTLAQIARILSDHHLCLATAESCTGGLIASQIVAFPGASEFFKGGIVAYADDIKRRILKVPAATLVRHGAVSAATVRAMARGAAKLYKCDCAVAVSGIAGPAGGTPQKPVGLVFIGVAVKSYMSSYRCFFKGGRAHVRRQATARALELFLGALRRIDTL
ncbi:MAG: CinA family protein [Chitinivibrionales bacterium]|nr:CinA family protein [Chitinivibrionales bacterium]